MSKLLKKTWKFIWDDDSVWSWLANVIIAFILIKYVVYPVLGLLLATSHPIVAVVSGSMEHDGNFDQWWDSYALCNSGPCTQSLVYDEFGITKSQFKDFMFVDGFNTGDIMILYGTKPKNLDIGDVLVFAASRPDPIIHRIVKIDNNNEGYVFQTKGDHNVRSIDTVMLSEISINENQVVGKAVLRIPFLGYVKIGFVKIIEMLWR